MSRAMIITTGQRNTSTQGLPHPLFSLATTSSTKFQEASLGLSWNWSIYWVESESFADIETNGATCWTQFASLLMAVCICQMESAWVICWISISNVFVAPMNGSWKAHFALLDIYHRCHVCRLIGHNSFDELFVIDILHIWIVESHDWTLK